MKATLIGVCKKAKRKNTWNDVYVDQYVENGEEYIKVYSLPDTTWKTGISILHESILTVSPTGLLKKPLKDNFLLLS